ncbi:hypothetical protein [Nocardia wallacei]|uniref:hypothetical protein n=1 Tax=Nocardia wallacei TaxID=480035 RepID=UPI0024554B3D|nr:hypothetical protein [Nocardia wallacei]
MPDQPRDQLARVIDDEITRQVEAHGIYISSGPDEGEIADAILTAGFQPPLRTIETVEELDALPEGSILRDRHGEAWRKFEPGWCVALKNHPTVGPEHVAMFGRLTVLWTPTPDGGR